MMATVLLLLILLLILVSVWIGFYQIFKQQGRILLRLDQLERNGPAAGAGPEIPGEQAEPGGLPLQSPFPGFTFPDLTGKVVALEDFRGRRVFLVNWNFECGFCDSIAAWLAREENGCTCRASNAQRRVKPLTVAPYLVRNEFDTD